MKTVFALLLFCFSSAYLMAQKDSSEWYVMNTFSDQDEVIQVQMKELGTYHHCYYSYGVTELFFQQKIYFLTSDCQFTLPRGESVGDVSGKWLFTERLGIIKPLKKTISIYQIDSCGLSLKIRKKIPQESEFYLSDEGGGLLTDFYLGWGKTISLLNKNLDTLAHFSPSEKGFSHISVQEDKNCWYILIKEPETMMSGPDRFYKLEKLTGNVQSLIDFDASPFETYFWGNISGKYLFSNQARLLAYHEDWQLAWEKKGPFIGFESTEKALIIAKNDTILALNTSSGNEIWSHILSEIYLEKIHTTCPEDLPNCTLRILEFKEEEQGYFLILGQSHAGWILPETPIYGAYAVFLTLEGEIIKQEKICERCTEIDSYYDQLKRN